MKIYFCGFVFLSVLVGCGGVFNNPRPFYSRIELYAGRYQPTGWRDGSSAEALLPSLSFAMTSVGNSIYFTDGHSIRAFDFSNPNAVFVRTVVGDRNTSGHTDGSVSTAKLTSPNGLTTDGSSLFISGGGSCIRKFDLSTNMLTTLAGLCGSTGSTDGTGSAARFNGTSGITYSSPYLYVADFSNVVVRRVSLSGDVSLFAGVLGAISYLNNAVGTLARFSNPGGLASDENSLYLADGNNAAVRSVSLTGTNAVGTLIGVGGIATGKTGSTDGVSGVATITTPSQVSSDSQNVYLAENGNTNYTLRKVVKSSGLTSTLAGTFGKYGVSSGGVGVGTMGAPGSHTVYNGEIYFITDGLLRKINPSTGVLSTVLGPSTLVMPTIENHASVFRPNAVYPDGNLLYLFYSIGNQIRKLDLTTLTISDFAGSSLNAGTIDGTLSQALFSKPFGMTKVGNDFYVVDYSNSAIRKIDSSGNVTTVAGLAGTVGYTNGVGTAARFYLPTDITSIGSYLYVVDSGNHAIRQINLSNYNVITFAGADAPAATPGNTDATGTAARFSSPKGIVAVGSDLYVADTSNTRIRKINSAADVSTFAGSSSGYAEGVGTSAQFSIPYGITSDGTNLYVLDRNQTLRSISLATATTKLLAGSNGVAGSTDGIGVNARFSLVASSSSYLVGGGVRYASGALYIAETTNMLIRKYDLASGLVSTLAGGGKVVENGATALAQRVRFSSLAEVQGDIYAAYNSVIWKLGAGNTATVIAGSVNNAGLDDGPFSTAKFSQISHLIPVGTNLYVLQGGNSTIRKVDLLSQTVTTVAGVNGVVGNADASVGTQASFNGLYGGCADSSYLYLMDQGNHTVRTFNLSTSEVKTIAGVAGSSGSQDGVGSQALFKSPVSCIAAGDSIYVSDSGNYTIRKINVSDIRRPVVTTFAGQVGVQGSIDAIGTAATFRGVQDLASDGVYLYATDSSLPDPLIRRIKFSSAEVSTFAGVRGNQGITQDRDRLDTQASLQQPTKVISTRRGIFFTDSTESILWIH